MEQHSFSFGCCAQIAKMDLETKGATPREPWAMWPIGTHGPRAPGLGPVQSTRPLGTRSAQGLKKALKNVVFKTILKCFPVTVHVSSDLCTV